MTFESILEMLEVVPSAAALDKCKIFDIDLILAGLTLGEDRESEVRAEKAGVPAVLGNDNRRTERAQFQVRRGATFSLSVIEKSEFQSGENEKSSAINFIFQVAMQKYVTVNLGMSANDFTFGSQFIMAMALQIASIAVFVTEPTFFTWSIWGTGFAASATGLLWTVRKLIL